LTDGPKQAVLLLGLAAIFGFGANVLREAPLAFSKSNEPLPPEPGSDLVSSTAEDALLRWEEGAFFLDVRPREDYERAHVSGAVWLGPAPLSERYVETLSSFDLAMPLFVYGAGPDSHVVRRQAAELSSFGHADVKLAVCGLDGLIAAGVDSESAPGDVP
jgi:rhodanese-related sulfurtransferase